MEVRGDILPYVSRAGLKLEKAIKVFDIDLEGKICMDVGASTGGFTDCMLQNKAKKVYCVDVGHGQLSWKLQKDERVICMEKTNIRYLTKKDITEEIEFVSIDVSFISLTKVLLPVRELIIEKAKAVCLIKPQFEVGKYFDRKFNINFLVAKSSSANRIFMFSLLYILFNNAYVLPAISDSFS